MWVGRVLKDHYRRDESCLKVGDLVAKRHLLDHSYFDLDDVEVWRPASRNEAQRFAEDLRCAWSDLRLRGSGGSGESSYIKWNIGAWLSLVRALRSGRRGRRFKSSRPDSYLVRTYVKSGSR